MFKPGDRVKVTTEATIISSDEKLATIRYDYDAIDVNELELIKPDPVGTRSTFYIRGGGCSMY